MIDTQAKPVSYMRLLVMVVLLGTISAAITFAFITVIHLGIELVWAETKRSTNLDPRLFVLLVCTLGGLLVGLLVRLFGDHSGIFADVMLEFGRTGRFEYRTAPGMVVTALVSLIAGASLGPEAPLADACGGAGTWVSDRLKLNDQETRAMGYSGVSGMLAALITAPLGGAVLGLESAKGGTGETRKEYFWVLFPSLLASAAATVVFVLLSGVFFQTLYQFPDYIPQMDDLFFAVPLGILGGVIGMVFMISLRRLQQYFQPMKDRLILRGLIGGLGMGLIGALLPLTLFSGEEQIVDLMARAAELGVVMLVILSVAKLLATSLLLATGWKGGYIFPLMFASVAMGLAVDLVFPNIPVAVTVAATMAGALVAALRAPLFSALFTITLVQKETAAVVAVAVVASALLTALLTLALARRSSAPERVEQETAET
jgi:H+/Cl- antiporter ClcA